MKKLFYVVMTLVGMSASAQVGIGVATADINPSAQLDVTSTTKGFLPPRMKKNQRDLIPVTSASAGLTIWCTNCGVRGELEVYDGQSWTNMVGAATAPLSPLVTIGTQVWTTQNLDVTTYRNGDPIPEVTDLSVWGGLTTGAWCYYRNDSVNGPIYGKLYNWYAVNDSRGLAPTGYHIPTNDEWTTLTQYLGGLDAAGGKIKEEGTSHWVTPNTGADNSSGFVGLPGGLRDQYGSANYLGNRGYYWTSTNSYSVLADYYIFYHDWEGAEKKGGYFRVGMSVRCVKD